MSDSNDNQKLTIICFPEVQRALEWWSGYFGLGKDGAGKAAHYILLHVLTDPEVFRNKMEETVEYLHREGFVENETDDKALRARLASLAWYQTEPPALGSQPVV